MADPGAVPQRQTWLIRKEMPGRDPFDSLRASIVGPNTEPVEVVPARLADQLAEALEVLVNAVAAMPDAGLVEGDPRYEWWWNRGAQALSHARGALAEFREGAGQ